MLTAELLRARSSGKEVKPAFIDPASPRLLERAGLLVDLVEQAAREGWTLGELQGAQRELEGVETDHRLVRGLFKVLLDRMELDTVAALPPEEARALVFTEAARRGPLTRSAAPGRLHAAQLLAELAAARGVEGPALADALYADLKSEQRVQAWRALDAEGLLHRYNLALVQGILLKATRLRLSLPAPEPRRLAQLLRWARFFELMYRLERQADLVLVELDGPLSLLRQSTRYGLNLARFAPAVLLQPRWRLEAELLWGPRRLRKGFSLGPEAGLRSHFRDTGTWKSRTELHLEERWGEEQEGWRIGPGEHQVVDGQKVVCPAWTFRKGQRVAHLDVLGHWRRQSLQERLASQPPGVVLAVSRRLCADAAGVEPGEGVILFTEILPIPKIIQALERAAGPAGEAAGPAGEAAGARPPR